MVLKLSYFSKKSANLAPSPHYPLAAGGSVPRSPTSVTTFIPCPPVLKFLPTPLSITVKDALHFIFAIMATSDFEVFVD